MKYLRKYNESIIREDLIKVVDDFNYNFSSMEDDGYIYYIYLLGNNDQFLSINNRIELTYDKFKELSNIISDDNVISGIYFFINTNLNFLSFNNSSYNLDEFDSKVVEFEKSVSSYRESINAVKDYMDRLSSVFGLEVDKIDVKKSKDSKLSFGIKIILNK